MVDRHANVLKTFNDYQDEEDISFVKAHITEGAPFAGYRLKEVPVFQDMLVTMVLRGKETIIPDGETKLEEGDLLVLAAPTFQDRENLSLREVYIGKGHRWNGQPLKIIAKDHKMLVVMIKRGQKNIIPNGDTVIHKDDTLVTARLE